MQVFDLRASPGLSGCPGFRPINQGDCNGCVAASMATLLSIQACMQWPESNTSAFSAQRIWDCYDGSCQQGVLDLMGNFFPSMMEGGPNAGWMLQPFLSEEEQRLGESNYSQCGGGKLRRWMLGGVSRHGGLGVEVRNASARALREHIMTKGPALAVVRMTAVAFDRFVGIKNGTLFVLSPAGGGSVQHALTVIGWCNSTGSWLVQNSMGKGWGADGVGWVSGPLEAEWYGMALASTEVARVAVELKAGQEEVDDLLIFGLTLLSMAMLAALVCVMC